MGHAKPQKVYYTKITLCLRLVMKQLLKKYPIAAYLVIAYAFSGVLWTVGLTWPALYAIAVYGPLLAALLVALARGNTIKFLKQIVNLRASFRWYVFIIVFAIGINIPSLVVAALTGNWQAPSYTLWALVILFATQLVTSGLEEPGWRGFLLPELFKRYPAKAKWLSGLAWAGWHLPMVLPMYWALGPALIVSSVTGFVMAVCGAAFVYAWLYQRTTSIWLAILLHAAINTAQLYLIGTTQNPATAILPALTTWAVVWALETHWPNKTARTQRKALK